MFAAAVLLTYGVVLGARAVAGAGGFTVLGVLTVAVVGAYYAAARRRARAAVIDSVPRLLTAPRPAPVTATCWCPACCWSSWWRW